MYVSTQINNNPQGAFMAAAATASTATPRRLYGEIMNEATQLYSTKVSKHKEMAKTIPEKIKEWGDLYGKWAQIAPETPVGIRDAENGQFAKEVDKYIEFRAMRDDLVTIREVFDRVIGECTPPQIDERQLEIIERTGFSMDQFRAKYKELFERDFEVLGERRREVNDLYEEVRGNLLNLRVAGEPLARLCTLARKEGGIGTQLYGAASAALNFATSRTPAFTAAVQKRLTEKAGQIK